MDEHQLQKGRNRSEYEKLAEDVRAVLPEISVLELGRKELGSLVVLTTWHPATLGCLVASSTLARTVLPLHPGGDGPVATMGLIFYALARMGLATDIGPLRNLSAEQLKDALSRASRENVIPEVDVDEKTMLSLQPLSGVYKICRRVDQMPPLLEAGLSSAKDIARMGEDVFESRFSRELGGEMEARHIYRGAIQDDGEPEEDTD